MSPSAATFSRWSFYINNTNTSHCTSYSTIPGNCSSSSFSSSLFSSLNRVTSNNSKRVWGCLIDRAKTCIVDKGGNRSHEARKGYAVAIDPDEGLLAEPVEVGAVAHVEVEAVSDDEEEGRFEI